jgi:two-component system, OmpR family, response regulator
MASASSKAPTRTVLLVDDNAVLLKQAEVYLTTYGINVVTHTSPFGVGALVLRHKPDVLVLDVMMPGLDGEQVYQFLQKQADAAALPPVVFYSAMAEEQLHQLSKRRPGTSYVPKSDGLRALHAAVTKLLLAS